MRKGSEKLSTVGKGPEIDSPWDAEERLRWWGEERQMIKNRKKERESDGNAREVANRELGIL